MNTILHEYIIFIIKIITIIIVPFFFIMLIYIGKQKNKNKFNIINLNKKYIFEQKIFYKEIYKKNIYKINKNKLENNYKTLQKQNTKNLYIINFNDDINAKDTNNIKKIISILIPIIKEHDEILLKLNSSGGFVNNYGLAAEQLKRLKNKNIKLTISIDLIAASGGYLMATVANKIIASHFAIIGSIGVISVVPNFNKILNKHNIEIEHHTAGEYKSTLNVIGKNTEHGRKKFIESLNRTHLLFKKFIKENRPILEIDKISTGEYWYAIDALDLNLIDKIQTSDEYILEKINTTNIYEIKINKNITFKQKLGESIKNLITKTIMKL